MLTITMAIRMTAVATEPLMMYMYMKKVGCLFSGVKIVSGPAERMGYTVRNVSVIRLLKMI